MENNEKIERLQKEIDELEKQKEENDKVNKLLKKRNELKYTKLFGAGRLLKKIGGNIANWADEKNKELAEQEKEDEEISKKSKKSLEDAPVDVYDAIFGRNELNDRLF